MTITTHANREAWLANRADATSIGCSDLAALLGVSRFRGPWDVYAERVLGVPHKPTNPEDLRRGLALEPWVLSEYALKTGHRLTGAGEYLSVSNPAIPWLRGSPDALVDESEHGPGGVDAKTSRDAWEWAADGAEIEDWTTYTPTMLPPDMALQGLGYMALTERPWWDFHVLLPFFDMRTIRVWRDATTEASLLTRAAELVDRHLVRKVPPDIDASEACKRGVQARYEAAKAEARAEKKPREATPEQAERLRAYAAAHKAEADAKEAKDLAANQLREALGGAVRVRADDLTISNDKQLRLTRRNP